MSRNNFDIPIFCSEAVYAAITLFSSRTPSVQRKVGRELALAKPSSSNCMLAWPVTAEEWLNLLIIGFLIDGIITWSRKPERMNQLFCITVAPSQSGENYWYVETLNKKRLSILQWNYGACAITFWGSAKKGLFMNYKLKWFLARWR